MFQQDKEKCNFDQELVNLQNSQDNSQSYCMKCMNYQESRMLMEKKLVRIIKINFLQVQIPEFT